MEHLLDTLAHPCHTHMNANSSHSQHPQTKWFVCIDFKSFYASVECVDRGLDPMTCNLVVADYERTKTTICLAITPAMKKLGIKNRCRLFEIPNNVRYLIAPPRMRRYMEMSAYIYSLYLKKISADDIHVYSIDECFIDITPYLSFYHTTPRAFAVELLQMIKQETGIPATAGIGTNLFLAKIALDISAKHTPSGIGYLDEETFKRTIWFHRPITDIWNIGQGIARRLRKYGVYDLAGICALPEETLYKEFGVNAEYLIDHAWGQEPCSIAEIRSYIPKGHSIANGQVLPCDYTCDEARICLREMVDASALDLVEKHLVTDHLSLYVGYSAHGQQSGAATAYERYRAASANVSHRLNRRTNSAKVLQSEFDALYQNLVDPHQQIRRISIGMGDLLPEDCATTTLFDDTEAEEKERQRQRAILDIHNRFGKNALLKGTSLQQKATLQERNTQIGGHRA